MDDVVIFVVVDDKTWNIGTEMLENTSLHSFSDFRYDII
jgi:hypothetical protein